MKFIPRTWLSCIRTAFPLDQPAGQFHPDILSVAAVDPVEQDLDRVVRHLALWDVDRGQAGGGLLRFLNVVDRYD